MEPIEEMKKNRFLVLRKVWEITGGDKREFVKMYGLGDELGFDKTTTRKIFSYLKDEGLIKYFASNGDDYFYAITHWGIKEIEEALQNPDKPTEHFSPINIISINHMENSQIQQSSSGSTQTLSISKTSYDGLKEVLLELKNSIDKLGLQKEQESDLKAQIATIEAQLSASKPNRPILDMCLSTIKAILAGAASTVAPVILTKLMGL